MLIPDTPPDAKSCRDPQGADAQRVSLPSHGSSRFHAPRLIDLRSSRGNKPAASTTLEARRLSTTEPTYDFETIKGFLEPGDRVLFYKPHQSFGFTIDTDENFAVVHDLLARDLGLADADIVEMFCNGDGSQIIARIEPSATVKTTTRFGNAFVSNLTSDD
ncbi:hypothetical protein [Methylobacterium durans]|uniref:hypothetical protein n=1 Tax=Methylobacterium durans TaxID=2202825 RepID=UPI0013A570EB|nr:hypothetical protein [Methylobacterium durans]